MPADMCPAAKIVWQRVLRTWGPVIKVSDADCLRCYCEAVARYNVASRLYDKTGPVVAGFGGAMVKNPLHQIVRESAEQVRAFARELGLTPSARAGLKVEPPSAPQQEAGIPPRLRAVGDE
jgi:P27 family predicted phage terminase small subunit